MKEFAYKVAVNAASIVVAIFLLVLVHRIVNMKRGCACGCGGSCGGGTANNPPATAPAVGGHSLSDYSTLFL